MTTIKCYDPPLEIEGAITTCYACKGDLQDGHCPGCLRIAQRYGNAIPDEDMAIKEYKGHTAKHRLQTGKRDTRLIHADGRIEYPKVMYVPKCGELVKVVHFKDGIKTSEMEYIA